MRPLTFLQIRLAPAALRRVLVASLTAAAAVAAAGPGCLPDVGDQYCFPSSDITDKDDRCPYGSPGGPKLDIKSCDAIATATVTCDAATPTFADVFAIMNDPARGGCTTCGCHGKIGANAPLLPPDDPQKFYDNLTAFSTPERKAYLDKTTVATNTDRSWIICNLQGLDSGGSPMPPQSGLADLNGGVEAIDVVLAWAKCGAQLNGTPVPGETCEEDPPPAQ